MNHKLLTITAICATMMACNSSKKQNTDEWIIQNDVWEYENIDLEEIAEVVDIKPIVSDEPIADLRLFMSGTNNDFIISDQYSRQTVYHIVNGRMTEKLNAAGNGPTEYNRIDIFSYLPSDSLLYISDRRGRIICYKTSPFKFVSNFPIDYFVTDMIALGRDSMLLTASLGRDSCAIYKFDGHSMKKLVDVDGYMINSMVPSYTRSGNDVLVAAKRENIALYQYAEGLMSEVATIDYGKWNFSQDKQYETELEDGMKMINWKDHARGCKYAQFNGSTLAYWHMPILKQEPHYHLTIATRDNIRNYKVHIGGLNFEVYPGMIDNGVYTMMIQGDGESKIKPDEELSPLGKRIIETLQQNDGNPIYLQFKLKDKYLTNN